MCNINKTRTVKSIIELAEQFKDKANKFDENCELYCLAFSELMNVANRINNGEATHKGAIIRYEGSNICLDFRCECGAYNHYDGEFAWQIKCHYCKEVYTLSQFINFKKTNKEQIDEPLEACDAETEEKKDKRPLGLKREDLENLVRSTDPSYELMDNPIIKKMGEYHGGFNDEWQWHKKFDPSLTDKQIWQIYTACRDWAKKYH